MSVILEQYNPHEIEPEVQEHWTSQQTFKAVEDPNKKNSIVFVCSHIHLDVYIWDTFVTIPLVT